MRLSININPLLQKNKSGIGYYESELIRAYCSKYDDELVLQYFDARNRGRTEVPGWLEHYERECCKIFPMSIYKLMCGIIPVPYGVFLKKKADATVFFNYFLPPKINGKRVVAVYDMVFKDYPETMNAKTRFSLWLTLKQSIKRADKIITISEFSKKRIMECCDVDESRIVVIPCAADREKFCCRSNGEAIASDNSLSEKYGVPSEYYLYLGTLEPRKNIERLIEAYSEARKQCDIPKLVIAGGKGWLFETIFSRVNELSLSDDVIFTGYVDDSDVPALMRKARAFCFPSLYEGFGMPPLEAMSCGTPVIVSDCSSLPEVVGDCGIKVDPYSVEQISAALIRMTDNDFVEEQKIRSLEQAEKFSWEKSADVLKQMLEELVNG